ncbi:MAG: HNH endonuclease [Rheinheimera sp.]|nr:HNH endonuclease [Rheinheimera sp.]
MRPIKRPACPIARPAQYKAYLNPLRQAFGTYCSYCERRDKLDVEHVVPTSHQPALELDWDNLLLGCPRCNRDFKKAKNQTRAGYIWPDTDDTFHAFEYLPDGRVNVAIGPMNQSAAALADLVKLNDAAFQAVLNLGRRDTFKIAERTLVHYQNGIANLDDVILLAQQGFWSVWLTVFAAQPAVVSAMLDPIHFPGTARRYFP